MNSNDGPHGPHGEHTHVISDRFVALWVVPGGSVVFLLTDDIIHFLPLNLLQVIGRGQWRWGERKWGRCCTDPNCLLLTNSPWG